MLKRLQHVICTIHNLEFGFDSERVRALGQEPALMRCPLCTREEQARLVAQVEEVTGHRDLLLSAINLAKTVQRAK